MRASKAWSLPNQATNKEAVTYVTKLGGIPSTKATTVETK